MAYKEIDPEMMKSQIHSIGNSNWLSYYKKEAKAYKSAPGDNYVRFYPPHETDTFFSYELKVHNFMGTVKDSVICPKTGKGNEGKKCPICDYYESIKNVDKAVADAVKAKNRVVARVNDVAIKPQSDEILIFEMPFGMYKKLMTLAEDKRKGTVNVFFDWHKGCDISFIYTKGAGADTYSAIKLDSPSVIPERYSEKFLPFSDLLYFATDEQIRDIADRLAGGGDDDAQISADIHTPVNEPPKTPLVRQSVPSIPQAELYGEEVEEF